MKLYFRPMPWLTVMTMICLGILISLGTWQYHRLQWKTALLAEIDIAADAAPFTSFAEVQEALDAGHPIDFRRIGTDVILVPIKENILVFTAANRDISWRVFAPATNSGMTVFAAFGVIADNQRDKVVQNHASQSSLTGYVRLAREKHRGAVKSTPEKNRWFGFNPLPETHDWADMAGIEADMRFYIDTVPGATDANLLPPKRPEIRNNHLDYMLTWYSFAIILLVIYFILHKRAGRLSFS